jgi:diamine N-acetyltransferase
MIGVEKSSISEDVNVNASLTVSITREFGAQVLPGNPFFRVPNMNPPPPAPLTGIALIPVTEAAVTALREMACLIWPVAYAGIIPGSQIDYMLEWMYAEESIHREMAEESIAYHWIITGGEKIGFLAAGPVAAGAPCPLNKCYLLPEHQRCGHGSAAIDALASLVSAAGATSIELRVNRENAPAIAFYRKNGFEVYATDCRPIGGGFVMDDYLMRRELAG